MSAGFSLKVMYGFDDRLAYTFLVTIPCMLGLLCRVWLRAVAKNHARELSMEINEQLKKLKEKQV